MDNTHTIQGLFVQSEKLLQEKNYKSAIAVLDELTMLIGNFPPAFMDRGIAKIKWAVSNPYDLRTKTNYLTTAQYDLKKAIELLLGLPQDAYNKDDWNKKIATCYYYSGMASSMLADLADPPSRWLKKQALENLDLSIRCHNDPVVRDYRQQVQTAYDRL
jgi:hypothetical protein